MYDGLNSFKLATRCAAVMIALLACRATAQTDLQVRGLLDVVGHGNDSALYLNRTNVQDSNFDNLRARVFVEGGTERTRAFLQVLFSDVGYDHIRFHGGYVLHRVFEAREVYLEAGKIPVHLGTWAPQTYSNKNPLVGIPLAYYYKSTLPYRQMPTDLEQLLSKRGRGQQGVVYTNPDGSMRGAPYSTAPMMYDNCWDYGAFVLGASHAFDWSLGTTLGAPGSPVGGPETNSSVSVHGRVGYAPTAGLALHLSAARGAYLWDDVAPYLPANSRVDDYAQTLWGLSLHWAWRHLDLGSEVFFNHFETPLRADGLGSHSYYMSAQYRFLPGLYGALRYDAIRFEVVDSAAGRVTWDENLQRVEAGVGYRRTRELLVKLVGQLNENGSGWDLDNLLPAAQVSFAF